jgi:hypothetical protein
MTSKKIKIKLEWQTKPNGRRPPTKMEDDLKKMEDDLKKKKWRQTNQPKST